MTKSEYLSNSAKLLMISSILLLVTNALVYYGAEGSTLAALGQKLSSVSFYAVLIMGFLAFNGEGIGYKRGRDYVKKKRTSILKLFLVFAFLFRYVKTAVEAMVLSTSPEGLGGITARLIMGAVNMVASYGFILTLASLWFLIRDINTKGLFAVESVSFLCGVVYNGYKLVNYTVAKYGVTAFGDFVVSVFSSQRAMQVMCLGQFFLNALMCLMIMLHYNKKVVSEQAEHSKAQKTLYSARRIYNTDCVGIDTLDDDYSI
ncbi:MAG: hypothetical protein IKV44_05685 [Clostridia bacterium]|nr:hypothetical protein [Clostridia bacterium]